MQRSLIVVPKCLLELSEELGGSALGRTVSKMEDYGT
jgi:hypothetical protein